MARTEYDLQKIEKNLRAEHKVAKFHAKQLIGAYAIYHDLKEARRAIDAFWDWHHTMVKPSRSELGDIGTEGLIGKALFVFSAVQLARALDMGADARTRVDLRPKLRTLGLEGVLDEVLEFRRKELAHYGGFTTRKGSFTNDNAVLMVEADGTTIIKNVYSRWNSERSMHLKLSTLIDFSQNIIQIYIAEKKNGLLSLIKDDEDLRRIIKDNYPDNRFSPCDFFGFECELDSEYEEPTMFIDWT